MSEEKKQPVLILIGRTSAGKTTLCQAMSHETLQYHKTQTVQLFNSRMIDTPGEYLERHSFWGALQVSSADADVIALVQDASEESTMFPPEYAGQFTKPVVGIVTKIDIATDKQVETAKKYLLMAGVRNVFTVSSTTNEGVKALTHYIGNL